MRILWLTKVPPESHAVRIWETARRLVRRGHAVEVITSRISTAQPARSDADGVEVRALSLAPGAILARPGLAFYASRLPWYGVAGLALARRLDRPPIPDVIVEDLAPVGAAFTDRVARRHHVPLAADVHALQGPISAWARLYGPVGLWGATYERWLRSGRIRPDLLISDSRPLLADLAQDRPDLPATWIPNGADLERFGRRPRRRAPAGHLRILAVGRLVAAKGHRDLIDAIARLPAGLDAHVTIVGDGPRRNDLERQVARLGLTDRVTLAGRRGHDELPGAFEAADLFVMPSLREGLPVVLVEALAARIPIVATSIPEHRQVAGETAIAFTPPGDPTAMAATIAGLAADPAARSRLARRGRAVAEADYGWDAITDRFEAALAGIVR